MRRLGFSTLLTLAVNVFLLTSPASAADEQQPPVALFGYSIGTTFPLAQAKQHYVTSDGFREIWPEQTSAPEDVNNVMLIATVASNTIVSIVSKNGFPSAKAADAFATKYAEIFSEKFGDDGKKKQIDYQRYRAELPGGVLATISVFLEDDRSAMNVMLGLKDNRGMDGPLMQRALKEWQAEVKRHSGR